MAKAKPEAGDAPAKMRFLVLEGTNWVAGKRVVPGAIVELTAAQAKYETGVAPEGALKPPSKTASKEA